MKLENEFVVPRGIDQTWAVLTDVERIAPAMPGAQLTEVVDGKYHGTVKVKVGPVTAGYAGVATFKELDPAAHHMVLEATGKESSGRGRASALVTADLTAEGEAWTRVKVVTDLTISGPLAQFGRGAIAEVSAKLLGQFVSQLEATVLTDVPATPPASAGPTAAAEALTAPAEPGTSAPGETTEPDLPVVGATAGAASSAKASGNGEFASVVAAADPGVDVPEVAVPASALAPDLGPTPTAAPAAPSDGAALEAAMRGGAPRPAAPVAEVNLLKVAAWPILKRLIPVVVLVAVVVILIVWLV
jgi:carbon monoxide dehydrogenase subunit G